MNTHIIPTLFAQTPAELKKRIKKLAHLTYSIHVDCMDGAFVSAKSIPLKKMPQCSSLAKKCELHLMVENPEEYLMEAKRKGFKKIIVHVESMHSEQELKHSVQKIKQMGFETYVALNPETSIEKVIPALPLLDGILCMGVRPGKEHQKFIPSVYKKVVALKKIRPKINLQVDGGVNERTIKKLLSLGVTYFNVGSYIAHSADPKKALKKLNEVLNNR